MGNFAKLSILVIGVIIVMILAVASYIWTNESDYAGLNIPWALILIGLAAVGLIWAIWKWRKTVSRWFEKKPPMSEETEIQGVRRSKKLKDSRGMRTRRLIFGGLLIGGFCYAVSHSWIGASEITLPLFYFLFGAYVLQGMKKIQPKPPHRGVVTIWGGRKPQYKLLEEGWRWLPLRPFWWGFIEENVAAQDIDFDPEAVRTPDDAPLQVPVSMTIFPYDLVVYINNGGKDGVRDILTNVVGERTRIWARAHHEGPQTWREAQAAQYNAVAVMVKAIAGDQLVEIPSGVPTSVLLDYFNRPQILPTSDRDRERWGEKWEEVDKHFDDEAIDEDKETVRAAVEKRRKVVAAIMRGEGELKIPRLGVYVARLNIGEIKVLGGLEKAAERRSIEQAEREGEIVELEHVEERIQQLVKPKCEGGLGLSTEQAIQVVQTERNKVRKIINQIEGGASPLLLLGDSGIGGER